MAGTSGGITRRSLDPRKTARALVPVAVVALVAGGATLAPALAAGAPSLPPITAQDLLAKVAGNQATGFSGTVQYTLDLGLPQLPSLPGISDSQLALLTGTHTLHAAAASGGRERIGIYTSLGETDVVRNGTDVWEYVSQTNTATHVLVPAHTGAAKSGGTEPVSPADPTSAPVTPQQAAQNVLQAVGPTTTVTVAGTESVAGRSAYTLKLVPKQAGSLVGAVEIAVDSATGAPLRVRVFAAGSSVPAIDVGFTQVTLAPPAASTFDFTPPPGAAVETQPLSGKGMSNGTGKPTGGSDVTASVIGSGWTSVFELNGVTLPGVLGASSSARPSASAAPSGGGLDTQGLINSLLGDATRVSGSFGSGRVLSTGLVTVLLTDDGRLYVGAVTPATLEAEIARPPSVTPIPAHAAPATP